MDVNKYSPEIRSLSQRLATGIRREQIANAALRLISKQGVDDINIAMIAEEVGLVPSAIYRHFSSKDEILDAVNELIKERLLASICQACNEVDDPVDRLHLLLKHHIGIVLKENGVPRYVFSSGAQGNQSPGKKKLFQAVKAYLKKVEELFIDAQKLGRVRQDLNPELLSYMYLGLIQPGILLHQMSDGEFAMESRTEEAWRIFIAAIIRKS